ncbi:MAG: hypothetical protein AB1635_07400 [Acidobacteriota bacterium]
MPKIILTDDPDTQVGSTFLDDSFRDTDSYAPVVVARILAGADLRWHSEVVSRLARKSRELKASLVLKHLDELPADLQRAVKRTIREACISILDARVYTFQFERMLSGLGKGLGSEGRSRVRQQFLGEFVRNSVLWDSPAWRIQRMLFPEPLFELAEAYGVSSSYEVDVSLFAVLRKKLQKTHSVRLFGARSAAAFVELLDPAERKTVLREISQDQRFMFWQDIDASVYLKHRATRHVFDEGNRVTVDAIDLLRESANEAVQHNPRLRLLVTPKGELAEGISIDSPELQAADVAAGYARRLYESEDGLKKVCLEFRQVLLNGSLVRDWQQQPPVG